MNVNVPFWYLLVALAFLSTVHANEVLSPAAFRAKNLASKTSFPELPPEAVVDVYYLEHVLTTWVLNAAPWNAFHSGVGLIVYKKKQDQDILVETHRIQVEYFPRRTDGVSWVLHPSLEYKYPDWMPSPLGAVYAWLTANVDIEWQNQGGVFITDYWPEKYTGRTNLGRTNGSIINQYRQWVFHLQETQQTFEPVEIVTDASVFPSVMCHDIIEQTLRKLYDLGFEPRPEKTIIRDHIVVFASKISQASLDNILDRHAIVRYYKLFISFMELVNKEFTHIRGLLVASYFLQVEPYLYKNGSYYLVDMKAPFVNYCYMQVVMPPKPPASIFTSTKLCALGENITGNATQIFMQYFSPHHLVYLGEGFALSGKFWIALILGWYCLRFIHARRTRRRIIPPSTEKKKN